MSSFIGLVTLLVREYDAAIAYFTGSLGFALMEDTLQGKGKRWVVARPKGGGGASLLLARAATSAQLAQIGNPAGGRVAFSLDTDDFARSRAHAHAHARAACASPRRPAKNRTARSPSLSTSAATRRICLSAAAPDRLQRRPGRLDGGLSHPASTANTSACSGSLKISWKSGANACAVTTFAGAAAANARLPAGATHRSLPA